ncbi:MAG: glycoside hydrolase family 43 protein [Spirochaetales bacterium]|nr:glycoside hydrolase family 43 protein [Spirochaetales bacterium]
MLITEKMEVYHNPILPGFYPDPSICRVGDDYYLVTSSFAYFPGVPIFHSRDLVNWKQIGHILDRPAQLDITEVHQSQGIFAPTLRYHQGRFYMITTYVTDKSTVNFIVTAKDPVGPWSDPIILENARGIDPSLYFEGNKAYYVGNREVIQAKEYPGQCEIWLQELDLQSMKLIGESKVIWTGALRHAVWPEGPHIYKISDYYYLLYAESGTAHHHSVCVTRSHRIEGPYEFFQGNPILTHRHLGREYPVVNVGHGDLVETPKGQWYMVLLGSRIFGGYYRNLGRETFMVPVIWEEGWPVASPGTGKVENSYPRPDLSHYHIDPVPEKDDFNSPTLAMEWNFIRTPKEKFYSLSERPGWLRLKLKPDIISELKNPSFVGRRLQYINYQARALMDFQPQSKNESAGLILHQNHRYYFEFTMKLISGKKVLQLIRCSEGETQVLAKNEINQAHTPVELIIQARGQDYQFKYIIDGTKKILAENIDGRILSTDVAQGFVGAYIGMYASGNGQNSASHVDFDWFVYKEWE